MRPTKVGLGSIRNAMEYRRKMKVSTCEMIADPVIAGVYAFQVVFADGAIVQYQTVDVLLQDITDQDLMEVEYGTWPPDFNASH